MSKARIFRQILERAKPPESEYDLWLEPSKNSFWLNVYKRETQEWQSLGTKAYWDDILDMPDYLATDDDFNEYVNNLIESAGIADSVAFKYDGEVSQITGLEKTLEREVDGEKVSLPSVDATLEKIIAKVWFKDMTASISGLDGGNHCIGFDVPSATIEYSIKNYAGGEGAYRTISVNSSLMSLAPSGSLTDDKGTAKLASFIPNARQQYKVTLDVACEDSNGNANGQKKSVSTSINAYWPYWTWSSESATATSCPDTSAKKPLTNVSESIKFTFENGSKYYYLLLPVEFVTAKQSLDDDWKDKFTLVNSDNFNLCNRYYKLYRTTNKETNPSETVTISVTVKSLN
jgi:hypothetical protein